MAAPDLSSYSKIYCKLQTGSKLAHVHPQRMFANLCLGLGRNQCYDVCAARVNVSELQWWI
jgi:hypothetical protein